MDRVRRVLRSIGLLLHVPGLMALVSLPLCIVFAEGYALAPFAVLAAGSGRKAKLEVRMSRRATAELRFLPVAYTGAGGLAVLKATPARIAVTIPAAQTGSASHYAAYSN